MTVFGRKLKALKLDVPLWVLKSPFQYVPALHQSLNTLFDSIDTIYFF